MKPEGYFAQSREERIYMTAFVVVENATTAMRAHDVTEDAKAKADKKK